MGLSESKNIAYEESVELFSSNERDQISGIYNWLVEHPKNGFSANHLQSYTKDHLTGLLSARLHQYMVHLGTLSTRSKQTISNVKYELFAIALAHILKGTLEQKSAVLCCMCSGMPEGPVTRGSVIKIMEEFLTSYKMNIEKSKALLTWNFTATESAQSFAEYLIVELRQISLDCETPEDTQLSTKYAVNDVQAWMSRSPLCLHLFDFIMHKCFPVSFVDRYSGVSDLVPSSVNVDWNKFSSLLTFPSLLTITQSLPSQLKTPWQLLYSSRVHGESFAMMTKRVMYKGPCVILLRDTKGHVFGGFIGEPLVHSGQFVGNASYFLFTLAPVMGVYLATGYNDNFIYFNQGQEMLPNGLGMGGQFGYFGLWLDYEYGRGHSKAQPKCTTYGSPILSAETEFEIDAMEVWRVGPDLATNEEENGHTTSILDKDPEAKAMLALIDKGPVSEGLREGDMTADSPGDHSLRQGFY